MTTTSEQVGTSQVQRFNRGMILQFLNHNGLRYLTDPDGDYVVSFGYSREIDCQLLVMLMASGSRNEIYVVRIFADKRIPKEHWGKALMVCNTWNKERRWPKAYLHVIDPARDEIGHIHLEEQLDLQKGIHAELLEDFTHTTLATGHAFWEWAHREHGL